MNNEWNSEVVTEVPESNITVDQQYDATSSNPQSGTAVAGAIGGVKQVPAYSDADSGKVLQVQADGTIAWVTLS